MTNKDAGQSDQPTPAEYSRFELDRVNAEPVGPVNTPAAIQVTANTYTWRWNPWEISPILFTNLVVTFHRNGDWETSCTIRNQSRHSNWDVEFTIGVRNSISGGVAFYVPPDPPGLAWFQDLDHGEEWNKSGRGNNHYITGYWDIIAAGTFFPFGSGSIRRDN
ncbi:hypothetical protein SH661x_004068 [Planctomicrobium sp. SH661]|uniref:hypothetical protein n=1 Tax=Planctomicrobium sp. SH661 TaxID=3448124 RepID=UPI003F5B2F83